MQLSLREDLAVGAVHAHWLLEGQFAVLYWVGYGGGRSEGVTESTWTTARSIAIKILHGMFCDKG